MVAVSGQSPLGEDSSAGSQSESHAPRSRSPNASNARRTVSTFCSEIRADLPGITGQVSPISSVLEAEVGERAVAVEVANQSRHLAAMDVEQKRLTAPKLCDLNSARLAAPAAMGKHQHPLA